jgi:hypothetical protein
MFQVAMRIAVCLLVVALGVSNVPGHRQMEEVLRRLGETGWTEQHSCGHE